MQTAVIGTAGRRDDQQKITADHFDFMCGYALQHLENTDCISGGAAWADHVAVVLFNAGYLNSLTLALPCNFVNDCFEGREFRSPGSTANYYHRLFTQKRGKDSLSEIATAIKNGAHTKVYNGFFARNSRVAQAQDLLIAFTFGTKTDTYYPGQPGYINAGQAGLKDGGTAHTWDKSHALTKMHVNLHNI